MATNKWLIFILAFGLLAACSGKPEEYVESDIEVSPPDSTGVSFDVVLENTSREVAEKLPGSYLTSVSIFAECRQLNLLIGTISLRFNQIQSGLFDERLMLSRAEVDTSQNQVKIWTEDVTNVFAKVDALEMDGLPVEDIVAKLQHYLSSHGQCDGPVLVQRFSTNENWLVPCLPPQSAALFCWEMSPSDGEINQR